MPIYEYKCPKCNYFIDDISPLGAENTIKCPNCKTRMDKQISVPSGRWRYMDTIVKK